MGHRGCGRMSLCPAEKFHLRAWHSFPPAATRQRHCMGLGNVSCRIEGAGVGAPWCQPCECEQLPTPGLGQWHSERGTEQLYGHPFLKPGPPSHPPGPAVLVRDGSTRLLTLPGARVLGSHAEVSGFPRTPRTGPQQGVGAGRGCGAPQCSTQQSGGHGVGTAAWTLLGRGA